MVLAVRALRLAAGNLGDLMVCFTVELAAHQVAALTGAAPHRLQLAMTGLAVGGPWRRSGGLVTLHHWERKES